MCDDERDRYGDETSVCESIRQRSMSLDQLPNPLIDEPITYRPQSTQTDRQTDRPCHTYN